MKFTEEQPKKLIQNIIDAMVILDSILDDLENKPKPLVTAHEYLILAAKAITDYMGLQNTLGQVPHQKS